jgi:hypothetical protein
VTENPQQTDAGDYRRAALLTRYRRQENRAGEVAIIEQTNELNRAPQLLFAILVLNKTFVTRFRTPDGIDLLNDYLRGIAMLEGDGIGTADIVRAAQIIDRHNSDGREAIVEVMDAAIHDGRGTAVLLAVLDHYEVALPFHRSQRCGDARTGVQAR